MQGTETTPNPKTFSWEDVECDSSLVSETFNSSIEALSTYCRSCKNGAEKAIPAVFFCMVTILLSIFAIYRRIDVFTDLNFTKMTATLFVSGGARLPCNCLGRGGGRILYRKATATC